METTRAVPGGGGVGAAREEAVDGGAETSRLLGERRQLAGPEGDGAEWQARAGDGRREDEAVSTTRRAVVDGGVQRERGGCVLCVSRRAVAQHRRVWARVAVPFEPPVAGAPAPVWRGSGAERTGAGDDARCDHPPPPAHSHCCDTIPARHPLSDTARQTPTLHVCQAMHS